jgi:hypothetical protein
LAFAKAVCEEVLDRKKELRWFGAAKITTAKMTIPAQAEM